MTANVVTAAIQQASLRAQIDTTRDIINAINQQLVVVRTQFEKPVRRCEPMCWPRNSNSRKLRRRCRRCNGSSPALQGHLLTALTGRFPNQGGGAALSLSELHLPTELPISLPSVLVQQRPDIRAAEEQLHQASAQIGVAIANMLPSLNLTAEYGANGTQPAQLFNPQNAIWSLSAAATQPIFHGGQLYHQERAAVAAYEQAEAQYRNTVITAFQNVADALRALQDDARAVQAQDRAVRVSAEASSSPAYNIRRAPSPISRC